MQSKQYCFPLTDYLHSPMHVKTFDPIAQGPRTLLWVAAVCLSSGHSLLMYTHTFGLLIDSVPTRIPRTKNGSDNSHSERTWWVQPSLHKVLTQNNHNNNVLKMSMEHWLLGGSTPEGRHSQKRQTWLGMCVVTLTAHGESPWAWLEHRITLKEDSKRIVSMKVVCLPP